RLIPPLFVTWLGATSAILATALGVIATGVAIIVALVVAFGLAQPLSGPALEGIVRRVEAEDGAPSYPKTSFGDNSRRSLGSALVSSALGLPLLAILFAVGLVFPPAMVVTFPLKFVVLALLASWDLCDYPLSIRGVPIRERLAFVWRNAGA